MIKEAKMSYDYEEDLLYILPNNRNYDISVEQGDFIFDLDPESRINGLEMFNASKYFKVPKVFLKNMVSADLDLEVKGDYIKIRFSIKSIVRNAEKFSSFNIQRLRPNEIKSMELNLAVA